MKTQIITYKLEGYENTFTYLSRFGVEDFYRDLAYDGWKQDQISILEIRDATAEEVALDDGKDPLESYFARFGTASE